MVDRDRDVRQPTSLKMECCMYASRLYIPAIFV
jgi:hypothetical protein